MSDANDNANVLTIARVRAIVREEIARALRERDQQKIRREEAEIDDLIAAEEEFYAWDNYGSGDNH